MSALLRRGITDPLLIGTSKRFDAEGGREAARKIFDTDLPPTALILANLEMGPGVFAELSERGLTIGKDISVIAWGTPQTQKTHLRGTNWEDFPFDLISWSREEMGKCAIRTLKARHINPFLSPIHIEIPTELLERGSSNRSKE